MKTILSLLGALFLGAVSSLAQAPQPYWMLTSPGALKAYATSRLAHTEAEVWGPTIVPQGGSVTRVVIDGSDVFEVAGKLSSDTALFKFELAEESDYVFVNGYMYDEDYNLLFSANSNALRPELVGGQWKLPRPSLKFALTDRVPIKVDPTITDARVYYRIDDGADGQFAWSEYFQVYDGVVYFPVKYAGNMGQLVLTTELGSTVVDIQSGNVMLPTHVTGGAWFSMMNYVQVGDKPLAPGVKLMTDFSYKASDKQEDAPVGGIMLQSRRSVMVTARVYDSNGFLVATPVAAYLFHKETGRIIQSSPRVPVGGGQVYFEEVLDAGTWYMWYDINGYFKKLPQQGNWWGKD